MVYGRYVLQEWGRLFRIKEKWRKKIYTSRIPMEYSNLKLRIGIQYNVVGIFYFAKLVNMMGTLLFVYWLVWEVLCYKLV